MCIYQYWGGSKKILVRISLSFRKKNFFLDAVKLSSKWIKKVLVKFELFRNVNIMIFDFSFDAIKNILSLRTLMYIYTYTNPYIHLLSKLLQLSSTHTYTQSHTYLPFCGSKPLLFLFFCSDKRCSLAATTSCVIYHRSFILSASTISHYRSYKYIHIYCLMESFVATLDK